MWLQIIINDVSQLLPVTDVEWEKKWKRRNGNDIKSKMSEIKRKKKVEKEESG